MEKVLNGVVVFVPVEAFEDNFASFFGKSLLGAFEFVGDPIDGGLGFGWAGVGFGIFGWHVAEV